MIKNKDNKIFFGAIAAVLALIFIWVAPVAAKSKLFSAEEIEQAGLDFLYTTLKWEASRLNINVKYEGKPLYLKEGKRSVECNLPGGHKRVGRVQFMCFIKINGNIQTRLRLYGEIKLAYDVYQTTRTLKRGHVLAPNDIRWVRVESSRIMRNTVSDQKELIGHQLIRSLNEGEEILNHMIKKMPLVQHGDRVLIVVQKGALRVTAPGVIKQDGFQNDTVRVENLQSRKIILGTVFDSRTIHINF